MVIEPQFEQAGDFLGGLARMVLGGRTGYIGKDGKIAINPQFEERPASSPRAARRYGSESAGASDVEGKIVINPTFEEVQDFAEGLVLGADRRQVRVRRQGGRDGDRTPVRRRLQLLGRARADRARQPRRLHRQGRQDHHQSQFEEAFDFNGDLAEVGVGGARGYIGRDGKFVWNPSN